MANLPVAFVLFYFICFLALQLSHNGKAHDIHKTIRERTAPEQHIVTREETEAEFLQWVQRIRAKTHNPASKPLAESAHMITVDKKGNGNFKTVQEAVNSVKAGNQQRVVIHITAGVYREKVKIPKEKRFITFQGAGSEWTIVTWHDTAASAGTTFKSSTVSVMSDYFIARDMTFKNSAHAPPPGAVKRQAVALQISGDKAAFYNCRFLGAQDTLYDQKGRHYFQNCFIQGSIDFIFGDGLSLYKGCELNTMAISYGSLTAQKRKSAGDDTGFSFVDCKVHGSGILYLGRAWGPYSRVVYISSELDIEVVPGGWSDWGDPKRQRTVFYGQYNCSGDGANLRGRVAWSHKLTANQAAPFMSLDFIDGRSWV